jgi:hypothetical protein
MPGRHSPLSACEKLKPLGQAIEHLRWGEHSNPRCCQFQRQWEPLQSRAEPRNRFGICPGHLEIRSHCLSPIHEQTHARALRQGVQVLVWIPLNT